MIKVGLVGIGGYADVYVKKMIALHQEGRISFCAAAVREKDDIPEVSAKLPSMGVKIYPDAVEMIRGEKEMDLVALPVGIGWHCPLTVEALKCGKNVLVEKPAAGNVEEIRKMMDQEKESGGLFVWVGFQHVFANTTFNLKQILLSGKYGAVKQISVIGLGPRNDAYYSRNEWVCRLKGPDGGAVYDSPINNAFAHYLNLALFFAGETLERSAHIQSMNAELYRARHAIETFDSCAVKVVTQGNIPIISLFSHATEKFMSQSLRIECENAVVNWDVSGNWTIRNSAGEVCEESVKTSLNQVYDQMWDRILGTLNGAKRSGCTLENALEHTYCIETLHKYFPIHDLSDEDITIRKEDGVRIVHGLSDAFLEAYNSHRMPSDLGIVSWTRKQEDVTL